MINHDGTLANTDTCHEEKERKANTSETRLHIYDFTK
jgi:hypothetical protein